MRDRRRNTPLYHSARDLSLLDWGETVVAGVVLLDVDIVVSVGTVAVQTLLEERDGALVDQRRNSDGGHDEWGVE
jgi:hypothetical protein